jgi:hypothetical protein
MALTPQEQQKLNKLLQEGIELAKKLGLAAEEASLRNFNGDLVQAERLTQSLRDEWQAVTGDIGYAYQGFKKIVSEITKQNIALKESAKGFSNLASIAQKIQNYQQGISNLSLKDITILKQKTQEEKLRLKNAQELLENEKAGYEDQIRRLGAEIKRKKQSGAATDSEVNKVKKLQEKLSTVKDTQSEINSLLQEQNELFNGLEKTLERTEGQIKNIDKALGLGGNAAKGLEKTLGSLGLGDFARSLGLDEVNKKMDETAKKLTDNGDKAATLSTKFKVLGAGMKEMGKQLSDNLFDPMVILGMILKGFLDLDKAQTEFTRETGRSVEYMDALNAGATTMSQYIKQATALTQQFGVAADMIFTPETIREATEMTQMMGMSNEEAGKLARIAKVNGNELKANNEKVVSTISSFNKLNKTGISAKAVLKDMATMSDRLALSFKGNPEAIAKAASEAKKLGLTFEQIDKIANSLLNFEDSIAAELEAELLTGKQINLEQARLYALNNDMVGLTKEIGNNQEIINAFSTGNRIDQEAIGKALGLNSEEMAKMIYDQQITNGLTEEQAAKLAGIELSDMKRLAIQEQINNAMAKMSEVLAGPLSALAEMVSHSWVLYTVFGLIAGVIGVKMVTGMISMGRELITAIPRLATILGLESGIAAAKISGAMAATVGLGAAAILGAIAVGIAAMTSGISSVKQSKDGVINPSGGLVISKPEGGVLTPIAQGIPGDYAYLTTNGPQQTQDAAIAPSGKGSIKPPTNNEGGGGSMVAELTAIKNLLQQIASTPGKVMIDGNEAGRLLAPLINQSNLQTQVKTQ